MQRHKALLLLPRILRPLGLTMDTPPGQSLVSCFGTCPTSSISVPSHDLASQFGQYDLDIRRTASSACHSGRVSFQQERTGTQPCEGCRQQGWPLRRSYFQQHFRRGQHELTQQNSEVFIYKGPLSQAVKNLKRLSLGGCLASILGAPILVSGAGDAMPLAAQASLVVTIGGFGLFTTGLLHWFTSPYVHRLEHDRKTGGVTVETMSILGQPQISKFHESAVRYPNTIRPQVTFEVNGKFFYLDADNFGDPQLLARLTPPEPAAIPEGRKNADGS